MAIAPIKKAYFFTFPEQRETLLKRLQLSGLVQLTAVEDLLPENELEGFLEQQPTEPLEQVRKIEQRVANLKWMIDILARFEPTKGVLGHFLDLKEITFLEDFDTLATYDETPLLNRLRELENRQHDLQKQANHARILLKKLRPFQDYPVRLEQFQDTEKTFVRVISIEAVAKFPFEPRVEELLGEQSFAETLFEQHKQRYVLVMGRKEQQAAFLNWFENQPGEIISFENLRGTAAENIEHLNREIQEIEQKIRDISRELAQMVGHLPDLRQACDYWQNELARQQSLPMLRRSRYTALATGWVPARAVPALQQHLSQDALTVYLHLEDPQETDVPPAIYDNSRLVQPFEFVTDLYSRPRYGEIDPTPFLSAFFALFFGICLTDAGYGLVLVFFNLLALKTLKTLSANSRKLLKILLYSGVVTTFVGLFTGGIFGLSFTQLPGALGQLQHVVLLNPLTNQMGFLIFSLALGVLHVSFGLFLKFQWNLRHQQKGEAWLDQAPWMAILLGVIILGVAQTLDSAWLSTTGLYLMAAAGVVILLFAGRASRNPLARLAKGIFSLYQISGLLGDILSYARLFALGLATGVIAGVVNFLAKMTLGIPYLGYVLMPLILISGHLLNLLINSLGGFIHTTRLQFVEFFGKFYEGGGEPFEPFQMNLKYTKIIDQESI